MEVTWEMPFGKIPLVANLKGDGMRCQMGGYEGLYRDLKFKIQIQGWRVRERIEKIPIQGLPKMGLKMRMH